MYDEFDALTFLDARNSRLLRMRRYWGIVGWRVLRCTTTPQLASASEQSRTEGGFARCSLEVKLLVANWFRHLDRTLLLETPFC